MLRISQRVSIPSHEIEFSAIRAQGAGGQNVNKVSTAIHLRFDILGSSLPEAWKKRLLDLKDQRLSKDGVIVIKSGQYRSQEKNRDAALQRLGALIRQGTATAKKRKVTRPTQSSKKKRLDSKSKRARTKSLRGKPHAESSD